MPEQTLLLKAVFPLGFCVSYLLHKVFNKDTVLWLIDRVDIDVEKVEDCILLAKQCKLPQLRNRLEMRLREMETFGELL